MHVIPPQKNWDVRQSHSPPLKPHTEVMSKYRSNSQVTEIIIHCAATPNGRPNTPADVDEWHGPARIRQGKKPFSRDPKLSRFSAPQLKHIGYHYVIEVKGTVTACRAHNETGAHARGHNTSAIGILMMGMDKFNLEQWDSLHVLVEELLKTKPYKILGHRDVADYKTCPGYDVAQWLDNGMQPLENHIWTPTHD